MLDIGLEPGLVGLGLGLEGYGYGYDYRLGLWGYS